MFTENMPLLLVVVLWVSRYRIIPVEVLSLMVNLTDIDVLDSTAPLLLRAAAW